MFKINDVRELIRAVDRSNIHELIIKGENKAKIVIRKSGAKAIVNEEIVVTQSAPVQAPKEEIAPPTEKLPAQKDDAVVEQAPANDESLHKITSPMVGTFYAAPSPDAPPYVNVGDKVKADTVVCIVEAMKLMNELEAEVDGEIVEILVENGQLVEYGQPIFLVKV